MKLWTVRRDPRGKLCKLQRYIRRRTLYPAELQAHIHGIIQFWRKVTYRLGGERYYPAELRRHIQFTENTVRTPVPYDLPKVHQKVPNRVPNSWRRNCKLVITPFFSRFRGLSRGTRWVEQDLRRRPLYPVELRGHI